MPDIPQTPVPPTEPIQPPIQNPVSQTPLPQPEPEAKPKSKKLFLIFGLAFIFLLAVSSTSYYFLALKSEKSQPDSTQSTTTATVTPSPTFTSDWTKLLPKTSKDPFLTLGTFLTAAQEKDKARAQTFISQNANNEAFRSLLNDEFQGIYKKDFTYLILENPKIDENGVTAQARATITVGGESLGVEYFLGKEDGFWYLLDSWAIIPPEGLPASFNDLLQSQPSELKRAVIRLEGPANFSLRNPIYGEFGFDSDNKSLEELGLTYSGPESEPETLTAMDLSGVWIMKVTGIDEGEFTILTEIVSPDNHQIGTFKYIIKSGEKKYFSVTYPSENGKPINVAPLN